MPKGLKRIYGFGHLHFITFSCYRRLPLLGTVRARNTFVQILGEVRTRHGFKLVGYVVMPEHVHLLISEPLHGNPSVVLRVLKQRVSQRLRGRGTPAYTGSAAEIPLRCVRGSFAAVLAASLLRFQRLESKEEDRETQLHARESGQEKAGGESEGLAVEQLRVLSGERTNSGLDGWTRMKRNCSFSEPKARRKAPPVVRRGGPQMGHPKILMLKPGPPARHVRRARDENVEFIARK
jgi:REP element-mobilizing transposase RayT